MSSFNEVAETVGLVFDGVGILVIILGVLVATARGAVYRRPGSDPYRRFRQDIGRGILIGVVFLVAAELSPKVDVKPTVEGVPVLGLIVLIRTFLNTALQVELEGRWPWQRAGQSASLGGENRPPRSDG